MKELEIEQYLKSAANHLDEADRLPELTTHTRLSVVVPAFNEEAYIANLITCLNLQNFEHGYEIIIVDNGSTDKTLEEVKKAPENEAPVYTISENKKGAGNARKAGVDEVVRRVAERDKGDIRRHYVAFTDADTRPGVEWLSTLYGKLSSFDRSVMVSGNYLPSPEIDQEIDSTLGIKNYFSSFAQLSELLDKSVGQTRMRGPNSGLEIECYVLVDGFKQPVDKDGNTLPRECFDLAQRIFANNVPIQHLDYPVLTSQRRKLYDIINGIYSYDSIDPQTGRFLSTRRPEQELLEEALNKVSIESWFKYRERVLSRIVSNTLLYPISSGMKKDLKTPLNISNWDEINNDSKKLNFGRFTSKWSLRIAEDLVARFVA